MSASSTGRSEALAVVAQALFRSRATPLLAALGATFRARANNCALSYHV